MEAALNPVAAVRLTVLKDSAVWAIISEVSHIDHSTLGTCYHSSIA